MATAYTGSIELISGIKPKNNGNFPLIESHDVIYATGDVRLDTLVDGFSGSIKTYIDNAITVVKDLADNYNTALDERLDTLEGIVDTTDKTPIGTRITNAVTDAIGTDEDEGSLSNRIKTLEGIVDTTDDTPIDNRITNAITDAIGNDDDEGSLSNRIAIVENDINDTDNGLNKRISTIEDTIGTDGSIDQRLKSVETAIGNDGSIADQINSAVNVEKSRAEREEDLINSEITTIKSGLDSKITSFVTSEKTRAEGEENSIRNSISSLSGELSTLREDLADEISNRSSKDDDIDSEIESINDRLNAIDGKMLVVSSVSDMTDTSRFYINKTDNNWYYYDTDTQAWVQGGNATGISVDASLKIAGAAADSKAAGDAINDLSDDIQTEYDGTRGITAGAAVRHQISDLRDLIATTSDFLSVFDFDDAEEIIIEPDAPDTIALNVNDDSISVSWSLVDGAYYTIERSTNGASWVPMCDDQGNSNFTSTTFTDSNVVKGASYQYRITSHCLDSDGITELSSYNHAVSPAVYAKTNNETPSKPTNISVELLNNNDIKLTWSGSADYYIISRKVGESGSYSQIPNNNVRVSEFTDTNTSEGNTYTYKVVAYSSSGVASEAAYSTSCTIQSSTPSTEELSTPNITEITRGNGTVTVKWTKVNNASGYRVLRRLNTATGEWTDTDVINSIGTNTTISYTDNTGIDEATYVYGVQAYKTINSNITYSDISVSSEITFENASGDDASDITPAQRTVRNITVGWNLANTLDATESDVRYSAKAHTSDEGVDYETSWLHVETTAAILAAVKNKGFNAIRIPVTWNHHLIDDGTGVVTISANFLNRVKTVVDMALAAGFSYVIVNSHHDTADYSNGKGSDYALNSTGLTWETAKPYQLFYTGDSLTTQQMNTMCAHMKNLWKEIATAFTSYDHRLIFEGFNEILGTDRSNWRAPSTTQIEQSNQLNNAFIAGVREAGGTYNPTRVLTCQHYGGQAYLSSNIVTGFDVTDSAGSGYIILQIHYYMNSPSAFAAAARDNIQAYPNYPLIFGEVGWNRGSINSHLSGVSDGVLKNGTGDTVASSLYDFGKNMVEKVAEYGAKVFWWDNAAYARDNGVELLGLLNRQATEIQGSGVWYREGAANGLVAGANTSGESGNGTSDVTPSSVTNITAYADTSNGRILLNWSASSNASYYVIKRKVNSGSWATVSSHLTTTSYTDTDIIDGSNYQYSITACSTGSSGNTLNSSEVLSNSVPYQVSSSDSEDITALTPSVTAAQRTIGGDVEINWSGITDAVYYTLIRTCNGVSTTIKSVSDNYSNRTYTDSITNLDAGNQYTYSVTAYKDSGTYSKTGTSSPVTIQSAVIDGTLSTPVVTATAKNIGTVEVSWPLVNNATYYTIERSKSDNNWETVEEIYTGSSYIDNNVTAETSYKYAVTAHYKDNNENVVSSETGITSKSATAVNGPTWPTASEIVADIKVGWTLGGALETSNKYVTVEAIGQPDEGIIYEVSWPDHVETTKQIFKAVKQMGFNAVRIPVTWNHHLIDDGYGEITISENFMKRVKLVVNWALKEGLYVILNSHHDASDYSNGLNSSYAFDTTGLTWSTVIPYQLFNADNVSGFADNTTQCSYIRKLWTQIAQEFSECDYHLLFEGFNELRGYPRSDYSITSDRIDHTNNLNNAFREAVRAVEGHRYRTVLCQTYNASTDETAVNGFNVSNDSYTILEARIFKSEDKLNEVESIMSRLTSNSKHLPVIIGTAGWKSTPSEKGTFASLFASKVYTSGARLFWWDGYDENYKFLNRRNANLKLGGSLWVDIDTVTGLISGSSSNYGTGLCIKQAMRLEEVGGTPKTTPVTAAEVVNDIKIGWNLGNTLECSCDPIKYGLLGTDAEGLVYETCWNDAYIDGVSDLQLQTIRKAGFNAIRIPITWNHHLRHKDLPAGWGGEKQYSTDVELWPNLSDNSDSDDDVIISPTFLIHVKNVVNRALNAGFDYVIINTHHDDADYQKSRSYYYWTSEIKDKSGKVTKEAKSAESYINLYEKDGVPYIRKVSGLPSSWRTEVPYQFWHASSNLGPFMERQGKNLTTDFDNMKSIFTKVWKLIAEAFKDYDYRLIFEGFNEILNYMRIWDTPDSTKVGKVNDLNQAFVNAVRSIEGYNKKRVLSCQPYGAYVTEEACDGFICPTDIDTNMDNGKSNRIILQCHLYTNDTASVKGITNYITSKTGLPAILGEFGWDTDKLPPADLYTFGKNFVYNAWHNSTDKYPQDNPVKVFWWDNNKFKSGRNNYGLMSRNNLEDYGENAWPRYRLLQGLMEGAGVTNYIATEDMSAPNAPGNIRVTSDTNAITVKWNTANNTTYYTVKRTTDDGATYTTFGNNQDITGESFTDKTAEAGTNYQYAVIAHRMTTSGTKDSESSSLSKPIALQSNTGTTTTTTTSDELQPPANITATGGTAKINVSWSEVTGASHYILKRKVGNDDWTTILIHCTANSYSDVTIPANVDCKYAVSSCTSTTDSKGNTTNVVVSNTETVTNTAVRASAAAAEDIGTPKTTPVTAAEVVNDIKIGWNLGNTLDCFYDPVQLRVDKENMNSRQVLGTEYEGIGYETGWKDNPETTQAILNAIKKAGFNAIRIPITWNHHLRDKNVPYDWGIDKHYTSDMTAYPDLSGNIIISPFFLARVKKVVNMALNAGFDYVIINTHHDDSDCNPIYTKAGNEHRPQNYANVVTGLPMTWESEMPYQLWHASAATDAISRSAKLGLSSQQEFDQVVKPTFKYVWGLIAEAFKDYDYRLIFEGFNEILKYVRRWPNESENKDMPGATHLSRVNELNNAFIEVVRNSGGNYNKKRVLSCQSYGALCKDYAFSNGSTSFSVTDIDTNMNNGKPNRIIFQGHFYSNSASDFGTAADIITRNTNLPCILGEVGWDVNSTSGGHINDKTFGKELVQNAKNKGVKVFWWDNRWYDYAHYPNGDTTYSNQTYALLNRRATTSSTSVWYQEELAKGLIEGSGQTFNNH